MATPWTRLEGTPLWTAAAAQYAANRLDYHNLDHVRRLYGHAERLGLAYDLSLDRAILAHDVILDAAGDNELRSAAWLDRKLETEDAKATELILTTIDHDPRHPDRRLAWLDLGDFADTWERRRNSRLLRDEAAAKALRRGIAFDQAVWVMGALRYLQGLHGRIVGGLDGLEGEERHRWSRVARGIAVTMAVLPLEYAPHPASGIPRLTKGMEATLRLLVADGPASVDRLLSDGDPELPRDPQAANAALRALRNEGMVYHVGYPGQSGWKATDEGRDWVVRMNAPQPDWPEPAGPDA
ncbi:hypothetical protein LAZ40_01480 [Cereibacter sphaeroides]|uniref:hypothetical protein n=1 Tax=Cereibacter sphaeroides TaxID=1063 RepID=UPI001F18B601|nr:hypothetical protein [Cereibacter sphaeroides]MCE6957731.1 hypothetical protein [Cereibacter sphaeroides]MCE6971517.1 hypothetical protein [Cereibacter sphaeroides]